MPVIAICSGPRISKNEFVTSFAPGNFHGIGKVTSAIDLVVFVEVDEISQQLLASNTYKTSWMPILQNNKSEITVPKF